MKRNELNLQLIAMYFSMAIKLSQKTEPEKFHIPDMEIWHKNQSPEGILEYLNEAKSFGGLYERMEDYLTPDTNPLILTIADLLSSKEGELIKD